MTALARSPTWTRTDRLSHLPQDPPVYSAGVDLPGLRPDPRPPPALLRPLRRRPQSVLVGNEVEEPVAVGRGVAAGRTRERRWPLPSRHNPRGALPHDRPAGPWRHGRGLSG